jgi:hypothetical protein
VFVKVTFSSLRRHAKPRIVSVALLTMSLFSSTEIVAQDMGGGMKARLLEEIIKQFQRDHYVDPTKRGKTYQVLIKDFAIEDEQTYAIEDQLDRFWIITLPRRLDKDAGVEDVCVCQDFPVSEVRPDLVAMTLEKGIWKQFTVPISNDMHGKDARRR